MSKSLIQTSNTSAQAVAANSTIALGSVLHRYGCNIRLNGNSVSISGAGYYDVDATVTLAPTAAGNVSISLLRDGVIVPGTTVTGSVTTAGNFITLPIVSTIREICCCDDVSQLSLLLSAASTISNVSMRVEKS